MKIWKHLLYCYVLNNGFKFLEEQTFWVRRNQPTAKKIKPEKKL